MKDAAPQAVYLADYTPPAFLVDKVHLTFRLAANSTRVLSRIAFRPNPLAQGVSSSGWMEKTSRSFRAGSTALPFHQKSAPKV